jgi:hypothetical protein
MLIKNGSFIEPVLMARGDEIIPFNSETLEKVYWKAE